MSLSVSRVKEEVRKILVIAVFFAIGFSLIHFSNQLLTMGSGVKILGITRALIGGLIVAKVLCTVDLLPFVHAFPHKPVAYHVGWKSTLYVLAAVVFLYMEPFFKSLTRGAGFLPSHLRAWHELMLPRTWATLIWVAMLLVVFVTLQELSRVIGQEEFKHIFLGGKGKGHAEADLQEEKRFRGAA